MSFMTKCYDPKKTPLEWKGGAFAKVLVLSLFAMLFAAGRLHLQFAVDDMQRQTAVDQDRQISLRSQIAQVQSDVEVEKRGDRMLVMGQTKMNMVRPGTDAAGHVMITQADIRKFSDAAEAVVAKASPAPAEEPAWRISLASLASRVGIVSEAVAAQADGLE